MSKKIVKTNKNSLLIRGTTLNLKKLKPLKFITHSDSFHADEIIATAFLLEVYNDRDVELVRSRDMNVIETGDIVYDVGFVCDPKKKRFDHHMATFTETFNDKYNVKLSSAGLIFKYYHKELFTKKFNFNCYTKEVQEFITDKIYREYFLPADALDNGYDFHYDLLGIESARPRSIQDMVAAYNVHFIESAKNYEAVQLTNFSRALEMVREDLKNYLSFIFESYACEMEEAMREIKENKNKNIFIPNKNYNRSLLQDLLDNHDEVKFVIFTKGKNYRIYAVNKKGKQFETRCPLKKEWRGTRDEELQKISGISEITFVHATGFTGGASTLEAAIKMCEESMK
ncbi:metal-dependent protein hydrolase domain-containing protein [Ecytonucleospora hepatopenaei]|uniref:Metal-dependent protein hydrolase domain-containing protein n=1 Tax=Ecytonucleospora hepatopenaei TaxID=646526 RepID=A0A1W0E583_9MICR|nr:metal-dependent protein hydrolase domain-containing protein [Ecytonucleospora hepatopenaei]